MSLLLKKNYDLIVIGAGSGGLGVAMGMQKLGFKVLLIDKKAENIGGECLNTGCVPSKALLHVAKQIHQAKSASRFGLEPKGTVDMSKVKQYVQQKQDVIRTHENANFLRGQGLDVILGWAMFESKREVRVGEEVFSAKNIVLATGSLARTIGIKGAETLPVYTNETVFDLAFIPENFIFVGAGPVSVELAQAFSRLGSNVSLVIRSTGILKKEDPEISEILLKKLQDEGINFYFDSEIKRINKEKKAVVIDQWGGRKLIPADALFYGLGRDLDFDSLKLQNAGIKTKNGKIILNDRLQTSNKNVFVSGDAAGNLKFSHAAEMHNMLLINNFIVPRKKHLSFDNFPWVTFTDPEIASFGLDEKKLKVKKIAYEKLEINFDENDRAVTGDFEYGKVVLYVERKRFFHGRAKILGGSMVAPNAGEIIQELVLANTAGLELNDLMDKIYAYPTAGNIHKTLARNRIVKDIKPWMKKILRTWYRIKE